MLNFSNLFKVNFLNNPKVKLYINNTLLQFAEQGVKIIYGIFVTVAVARHLGPESYGVYSYVLSVVTLVSVIGNLGLQNLVKKDLVELPNKRDEILGTSFTLGMIASSITFLALIVIVIKTSSNLTVITLFLLLGAKLFINPFSIIDIWFRTQVKSVYAVKATILTAMLYSFIKAIAIYYESPLNIFGYIFLAELSTLTIFQIYFYGKVYGSIKSWSTSVTTAKWFLSRSWPLIASAFASVIYLRIDQIMIGNMIGETAVGTYAIASQISSALYFVPQVLAISMYPILIKARKTNQAEYRDHFQFFYDLNSISAYIISLSISLFAYNVVSILFGAEFEDSAKVLVIHSWSCIFVFSGIARTQFLIAEDLLKFGLVCNLLGASSNICLNAVLIPIYGVNGAALGTLISYAVATFLSSFFVAPLRTTGRMQLYAYLIPIRPILKKLIY